MVPFNWRVVTKLYRGILLAIVHVFFIGLNIYGWSSSGVNHVLIFEIDPRNHLTHQDLLEASESLIVAIIQANQLLILNNILKISVFLGVIWIINLIAFVVSAFYQLEYYVYPLVLIVFLAFYLMNPFRFFHKNSRFWLLKVLWRVMSAPFYHVGFADFWLADQLTSFEFIFTDIQFIFCWYLMAADWAPLKRRSLLWSLPTAYSNRTQLLI